MNFFFWLLFLSCISTMEYKVSMITQNSEGFFASTQKYPNSASKNFADFVRKTVDG